MGTCAVKDCYIESEALSPRLTPLSERQEIRRWKVIRGLKAHETTT